MDDLLTEFLTEANESLAGLDEALLTLERSPDDAGTVALIFRLVHTIKGTCGFLGLPRLERVAHAAENVLGLLREGSLKATPALVTCVLQAVDVMREIVGALAATGLEPQGEDTAMVARLDAFFSGTAETELPVKVPTPVADQIAKPARQVTRRKRRGGEAVAGNEEAPATAPRSKRALAATGEAARAPKVTGAKSPDVEEAHVSIALVTPQPSAVSTEPEPARPVDGSPLDGGLGQQTIRVSVGVLENLMTLVSELVLTRNQLLQISRTAKDATFAVPVQRLSQITSDLQEGVMKTRMQPIGSAWSKLPQAGSRPVERPWQAYGTAHGRRRNRD